VPGSSFQFQTWMLGNSFITQISGIRIEYNQVKEPARIGSVELSDSSNFARHEVPFTFVIAYQPDDITSPSDFPVRYYEALPIARDFIPRVANMETVSARDSAWYAWWPLQRVLLARQGQPT